MPVTMKSSEAKASRPPHRHVGGSIADLFFIMFYVGAVTSVSNILFESPTAEGLLYFLGTLLPIVQMWFEKMCYGAHFTYGEGVWHRIFEVIMLMLLATAVLHIQPVEILSNPSENNEMFIFGMALVLSSLWTVLRYFAYTKIENANTNFSLAAAGSYVRGTCASAVFYLGATILAGFEYFGDSEETSEENINIAPIHLILLGSGLWWANMLISALYSDTIEGQASLPANQKPPSLNKDAYIASAGEWTMIVLGGSVLPLLARQVFQEEGKYYFVFYALLLMLVLLQILHFRSQPRQQSNHALKRNKYAGVNWIVLQQVYSTALLVLGASCRLLIFDVSLEDEQEEGVQRTLSVQSNEQRPFHRWLIGNGASGFSTEDREQRIADIFCFAMATVFFCIDTMILLNNGYKNAAKRCTYGEGEKRGRWREKSFSMIPLRVALIVVIATFSRYETDPENIAGLGVVWVLLQHAFQALFDQYFPPNDLPHTDVEKEDDEVTLGTDDGSTSQTKEKQLERDVENASEEVTSPSTNRPTDEHVLGVVRMGEDEEEESIEKKVEEKASRETQVPMQAPTEKKEASRIEDPQTTNSPDDASQDSGIMWEVMANQTDTLDDTLSTNNSDVENLGGCSLYSCQVESSSGEYSSSSDEEEDTSEDEEERLQRSKPNFVVNVFSKVKKNAAAMRKQRAQKRSNFAKKAKPVPEDELVITHWDGAEPELEIMRI